MHNAGKILIGLIIFIVLTSYPIWYAKVSGNTGDMPELEKAAHGDNCILDSIQMREIHMELVNQWRDEVVRDDDRYYHALDGTIYEKSLTRTCLGCHVNKDKFCDRCHNYLAVSPYCWDCHVDPKGVK